MKSDFEICSTRYEIFVLAANKLKKHNFNG